MNLGMPKSRHRAFYAAGAVGVLVLGLSVLMLPAKAVGLGIDAFFIAYLVFSFWQARRLTAAFLEKHADEADAPVWLIFGSTAVVIAVSVVSLFQVINSGGGADPLMLAVAGSSVVLGWFVVHSLAAQHYAYEYYSSPEDRANEGKGRRAVVGGLDFPTGKAPDGFSFVYFSYVIGMTAQVADVSITSREMQRRVLIHSIFSFFFNTVILAASVNIAVSLGSG
ncbi:MAG TPA: DUF1345 domain-containing protein [Devosiaceae bacterium]|jgi:uncharacterized membrane protein